MNGCSNSIGSPEPRCIGARSVMLPDTKGDTGGTASASATVCPRDRQHGQRQRYPRRCQAAVVGEFEAAAVAHPDEGRCGVPAETRADDDQRAGVLRPALFHGPPRTLGVRPGIWRRRAGTSRAAMVLRCLWWSWRGRAFDKRRRLAHRLPVGHPRTGGAGRRPAGGAGLGLCAALVRPCSGDRRISVSGRSGESTRRNWAHRHSLG